MHTFELLALRNKIGLSATGCLQAPLQKTFESHENSSQSVDHLNSASLPLFNFDSLPFSYFKI
jgi:hypothetical protein